MRPTIVDGSVDLMRAAAAVGVRCFVLASSLPVDSSQEQAIGRDTPATARLGYGRAKRDQPDRRRPGGGLERPLRGGEGVLSPPRSTTASISAGSIRSPIASGRPPFSRRTPARRPDGRRHAGRDGGAHRRLVTTNWVRTALWTGRSVVALALLEAVTRTCFG